MNKFTYVIIVSLFCISTSHAQRFIPDIEITFGSGQKPISVHWQDFTLDGSLDLMVQVQQVNGLQAFVFFNNTGDNFVAADTLETGLTHIDFTLYDSNLDGQADIVYTGWNDTDSLTSAFYHVRDFEFEQADIPYLNHAGEHIWMSDLDQDGRPELILSGIKNQVPFFQIYSHLNGVWTPTHQALELAISQLSVFDYNKDGLNDLLLSGKHTDQSTRMALWYNPGAYDFNQLTSISNNKPFAHSIADWDNDGWFDILAAEMTPEGTSVLNLIQSNSSSTIQVTKLNELEFEPNQLFAADFNSDGTIDYFTAGLNEDQISMSKIVYPDQPFESLPEAPSTRTVFGDWDYDGDLDLVRIEELGTATIRFYLNTTETVNAIPGKPTNPLGIHLFNRVFLFWEQPEDDHTPNASLTYDVILQSTTGTAVTGNFDLITSQRTQVAHGNSGTRNFVNFRNMDQDTYEFHIQAIDNAFHAGPSICSGSTAGCITLSENKIELCGEEKVNLASEGEAYWFSFKSGFLGIRSSYYVQGISDTLLAYYPPVGDDCARARVFLVNHSLIQNRLSVNTQYVCEGTPIQLTAESGWSSITWSSSRKGFLSNASVLNITIDQPDSIILKLSDGSGCIIEHKTAYIISKPALKLNGDVFTIMRGDRVQLEASGGEMYQWSPALGLNRTDIPNPLASPEQTTEYVVTAIDSLGCTAEQQVLVQVEVAAFIPNLFTPNQDGKNDMLKIYGLIQPSVFSFAIYNREGNRVYYTDVVADITQLGWDGTARGSEQPPGVYYWKVEGTYSNGKPVLLNGKNSGSLVIIR
ncbi:MAG: FG-GAP-like repeat-containing protein [Cyclobacteriaceae bacterium]|jgi:gliding motility-associated-like protein|nr:FG-GAP-like repeat-containing protein [Cyclobacteriaceae bacterium]